MPKTIRKAEENSLNPCSRCLWGDFYLPCSLLGSGDTLCSPFRVYREDQGQVNIVGCVVLPQGDGL